MQASVVGSVLFFLGLPLVAIKAYRVLPCFDCLLLLLFLEEIRSDQICDVRAAESCSEHGDEELAFDRRLGDIRCTYDSGMFLPPNANRQFLRGKSRNAPFKSRKTVSNVFLCFACPWPHAYAVVL